MTAQDQLTLRTLIFHNEATDAAGLPEYRLLNQLGHDVATTGSIDQAMAMLQDEPTDLVLIDADRTGIKEFFAQLPSLPADQQPRQIAVFTDAIDEYLSTLAKGAQRSNVHVLLNPLQMHGLLNILRNAEGKA